MPKKGYSYIGTTFFNINEVEKKFDHMANGMEYYSHSSGTFKISRNLIILKSDTDISNMPISVKEGNIKLEPKEYMFILKFPKMYTNCNDISYSIIINDSINYPVKKNIDTLYTQKDVKQFRLKIDETPRYNIPQIINGKKMYLDDHNWNKIYISAPYKISTNNFYEVSFEFNSSMDTYYTMKYDTLILHKDRIINKKNKAEYKLSGYK